jgi:hypothetical protein
LIVIALVQNKKESAIQLIRAAEEAQIEEKKQNEILYKYNEVRSQIINKYGDPVKEIILEKYNIYKEIIAFEESKIMWVCGNEMPMKSVLGFSISDNKEIIKGDISSISRTNTGNMLKRAIVGDVLLGGAGAIIGASTASKNTITTQESDIIFHDYTIIINVDSLSDPIIYVELGSDEKLLNEIAGLLTVVVNRN